MEINKKKVIILKLFQNLIEMLKIPINFQRQIVKKIRLKSIYRKTF